MIRGKVLSGGRKKTNERKRKISQKKENPKPRHTQEDTHYTE